MNLGVCVTQTAGDRRVQLLFACSCVFLCLTRRSILIDIVGGHSLESHLIDYLRDTVFAMWGWELDSALKQQAKGFRFC